MKRFVLPILLLALSAGAVTTRAASQPPSGAIWFGTGYSHGTVTGIKDWFYSQDSVNYLASLKSTKPVKSALITVWAWSSKTKQWSIVQTKHLKRSNMNGSKNLHGVVHLRRAGAGRYSLEVATGNTTLAYGTFDILPYPSPRAGRVWFGSGCLKDGEMWNVGLTFPSGGSFAISVHFKGHIGRGTTLTRQILKVLPGQPDRVESQRTERVSHNLLCRSGVRVNSLASGKGTFRVVYRLGAKKVAKGTFTAT